MLAIDMLRAGYAKAFVPAAAVLHSHDYSPGEQLRRCFDEWRGLREIYGWREPASPVRLAGRLRGALGHARREALREELSPARRRTMLAAVGAHNALRLTGALLGSRADRLPPAVRRRLAAVRRVWVVEVSRAAGPQRLPLLQGLRFRIARKWHVSDIWLMLYRHRHRHRHRHPHSHHHPYQRQPRQLSRPPPLPGRPRRAGGFGAGRYWQSIARRLPARVNRSPLEH